MLLNYFKTAFRNIKKQKGHFFLNIIGLTVGLVTCLLILLFVQHEFSYDRFNAHFDQIYRVQASIKFSGINGELAAIGAPTGPALLKDYPEIKDVVRFWNDGSHYVEYENTSFNEAGGGYTDPSFFNIFSVPLISGQQDQVLQTPNTMVISESMAKKYFGSQNPVGKTLQMNNEDYYEIQGVYEDIPDNMHFTYDFLLSFSSIDNIENAIWMNFNYFTYVQLNENVDIAALNDKLLNVAPRYCGPELQQFMGASFDDVMSQGNKLNYYLEHLGRIHLHTVVLDDIAPQGDIRYVAILSIIALFILVIACFNFINLTTARSGKRAMEVALRKVVGGPRTQIMTQFLVESFVICAAALFLAIILATAVLPMFNSLAGKSLAPTAFLDPMILLLLVGILLLTSLGAGLYPALFLSSFKPVTIFKDKLLATGKGKSIRSILVVFQFSLSITLLIGTAVVSRQLNYIQNKKLGFEKERVLMIKNAAGLGGNLEAFKESCLRLPEVNTAAVSSYLPVPSLRNQSAVFPGTESEENGIAVNTWLVDEHYLETLGIQLASGRNFRIHSGADSMSVIINETAATAFGWTDPLGKVLRSYNSALPPVLEEFMVVGVIKDFHFESLKDPIGPMALFNRPSTGRISFRLDADQLPNLVGTIETIWEQFAADQPFVYSFLVDSFNDIYHKERQISQLFTIASVIAIVIGCLGLLGLAAFTAEQKTKEIGIRKVLGASSSDIVVIMTKTFLQWVLLANIVSIPLAWYFMQRWLSGFAYRIQLEWWVFLSAGFAALVIALVTVGFQAIRAALANPAKSLKYE